MTTDDRVLTILERANPVPPTDVAPAQNANDRHGSAYQRCGMTTANRSISRTVGIMPSAFEFLIEIVQQDIR